MIANITTGRHETDQDGSVCLRPIWLCKQANTKLLRIIDVYKNPNVLEYHNRLMHTKMHYLLLYGYNKGEQLCMHQHHTLCT